jgi:hypothetical protein
LAAFFLLVRRTGRRFELFLPGLRRVAAIRSLLHTGSVQLRSAV